MNSAFEIVFTFVIMLGLGFALARAGLLDAATSQKVTSIVLWIFVPASMLYNVYTYLDADALLRDGVDVLVPFVTTLAAYALARLLCMALRVPAHKRGVVCAMFALSNTIFVGLPVNQALFGDVATPYALFYFMGNTVVFWTLGVWGIRRDGGTPGTLFSRQTLRKLLSPALVTLVIAMALVLLRVPLPQVALSTAKMLGAPGTPLAMLLSGAIIQRAVRAGAWKQPLAFLAAAGSMIVAPLLALGVTGLLGLSGMARQVLITQAAMPVMSQTPIVALAYGADDQLATAGVLVTMLGLLIVAPALALVFGV